MIEAVAFCPHPPVLVPALAGTAAGEAAGLLGACDAAVATLVRHPTRVVVLGSAARTARVDPGRPGALGNFGGMSADGLESIGFAEAVDLPLSLAIGRWLLERADPGPHTPVELWGIGADDEPDLGSGPTALLVMGDGSARRGLKAPGYVDERAGEFDAQVARALHAGDPDALAGLDPALGVELLAAGVPAWRAAGRVLAGTPWQAQVAFDDDPFGVQYFVATWSPQR